MSLFHIFIAFIVAAVWGLNFVMVKIGLTELPTLLFCSLRFFISLLLIFFIPKPKIPWSVLLGIGLSQGTIKFTLMFLALKMGMAAGLSSLVLQTQVFFTLGLTLFLFGNRVTMSQFLGVLIAFSGIALIAMDTQGNVTFIGFILTLASACSWAVSNLFFQRMKLSNFKDVLGVIAWSSLIPPLPLLAASFVFEGPELIAQTFQNVTWVGISCLLFAAMLSTWVGATLWGMLASIYGANVVAPYSLLIPIFGLLFGYMILGETLTPFISSACGLVFAGLAIHHFAGVMRAKVIPEPALEKAA